MKNRVNVVRSILATLLLVVVLLGSLLVVNNGKRVDLQERIDTQQDQIKELEDKISELDVEYFTLTVVETDGSEEEIKVYDIYTEMTIMDALVSSGTYEESDFVSYDGINYYFKDTMTDVNELKEDTDFYETSEYNGVTYTSLIVGLNNIPADQDYTIERTSF